MSEGAVVCNASPLIAFSQVDRLDILEGVFGTLVVPPAVHRETARSVVLPSWIRVQSLAAEVDPRVALAGLGAGETEAISLALELSASRVVLDDNGARRLARRLSLPVIGTLGVLLAAKRRGIVPEIRVIGDAPLASGFFVSPHVYGQILHQAGEA